MPAWIWIAVAGAAGSVCRHLVGLAAEKWLGTGLPWGTFAVNAVGSLLLGFVMAAITRNPDWPPAIRLAVCTGFLGAFTTFSTFSVDTVKLLQDGRSLAALGNVAANVGVGVLLALVGFTLAQRVWAA